MLEALVVIPEYLYDDRGCLFIISAHTLLFSIFSEEFASAKTASA